MFGQILGDVNLGAKVAYEVLPSFYTGVDLALRAFTVEGTVRAAFRPAFLLTWNLQEIFPRVPLVAHSNAGVHLGRTSFSPEPNKAMWQTFSWNLNSRHYGFFNLALEVPLPYATPFVEYQADFPFWSPRDASLTKTVPQSLVLGTKLTMLPNLTVTLGSDIRLNSRYTQGVVPPTPWRFFLGVSFASAPSSSISVPQKIVPQIQAAVSRGEEPPDPPPPLPQLILAVKRGNKVVPAKIYLRGPHPQSFLLSEETPVFSIPPGPQLLEILPAEGLARVQKVDLNFEQTLAFILDIESKPATAPVHLVNRDIRFTEPLSFAPNKTELTAQGHAQLRALVDLLVRNHIQKIRIESHVESQSTEEIAMQLSAQRSQQVVQMLKSLGIDAERIEVLNWGDRKPVAPNTVRRGRLLNRRMELTVLQTWP